MSELEPIEADPVDEEFIDHIANLGHVKDAQEKGMRELTEQFLDTKICQACLMKQEANLIIQSLTAKVEALEKENKNNITELQKMAIQKRSLSNSYFDSGFSDLARIAGTEACGIELAILALNKGNKL